MTLEWAGLPRRLLGLADFARGLLRFGQGGLAFLGLAGGVEGFAEMSQGASERGGGVRTGHGPERGNMTAALNRLGPGLDSAGQVAMARADSRGHFPPRGRVAMPAGEHPALVSLQP